MPAKPAPGSLEKCALLFAIPLSRDDFDDALRGTHLVDYGSQLAKEGDPEILWREGYRPSAEAGLALGMEAEAAGARLYWQATLKDLADATRSCAFVILFAHMAGAFFRAGQLKDPATIRALLADPRGPFAPWAPLAGPDGTDGVVTALNAMIGDRRLLALLPDMMRRDGEASVARGQALCRDLIDEWLGALVEPGNRIELFDGLHPPGDLVNAIASDFAGEIDLATCTSTVIAPLIDMRGGPRIRLSGRAALTVPYPEFVATRAALRLLAETGDSYLDARLAVAREIDIAGWEDLRIWH